MELIRITINNFRSIKKATIEFNHNCLIFLGKNEAGKSNALKAIASVFEKYQLKNKDKRKKIDNEHIETYEIMAVFKLIDTDIEFIEQTFLAKYSGIENISFKNNKSIKNFIESIFKEFLIIIKIEDNSKPRFSYWEYKKNDFDLITPLFLNGNEIQTESGIEFDLKKRIFELVQNLYIEKPLTCHYWQYSDDYLLPNSIDINVFTQKPATYKSLENIFTLCNRENIHKEFNDSKIQDGDYSNLLEQVSNSVTKIFRSIWDDFKDTSIQLIQNGNEILVKVVNKTKYSFEERSEGFKKFISILLMLSTQSRSNKINADDIILIDEPDQSLYPTSAKFLRDELLNIAAKSKIIYSTHSQYMIDENCLDRHIVVEKKDDVTTFKKEDANAPYTTDELLRRAIGSSIFECIKSKNIVFEGYLDKKLFNLYCKSHKLEKEFKDFGQIYLAGISGVDSIVSILSSANKKFIIVADSDEASKNKRIDYNKNHPDFKDCWLAYADVQESISTMEDFFTNDAIEIVIKKFNNRFNYNSTKNAIQNIEIGVDRDKDKKQDVKNGILNNFTKESVLEIYSNYLDTLKNKLIDL